MLHLHPSPAQIPRLQSHSMFHHIGELPKHQYVWIPDSFICKDPTGALVPAVWFGLSSTPGRTWGCTVLLECGAIYRSLPPNAIRFSKDADPTDFWCHENAQRWDCYGWRFSCIEYTYMRGMDVIAKTNGGEFLGQYLFTAAPFDDGFLDHPSQAKEFTFIRTRCNHLTIQPTDKLLVIDTSFTPVIPGWPDNLKRCETIYSCE